MSDPNKQIETFEESVKARMKEMMSDLIPEDRWNAIVDKAVKEFETVELPLLIKKELSDKYKQLIRDEFGKPEWQQTWEGTNAVVSESVKNMIIDSAPLILSGLIGNAMETVIYDLRNRIQAQNQGW